MWFICKSDFLFTFKCTVVNRTWPFWNGVSTYNTLNISSRTSFEDIFTQEFKPHKKERNELFLFNLARDPNETENLAESEPTIVQELKKIVKNLTKVSFLESF